MDQSPDDVYPYEFYVRLKLDEWARFKSGEGVAGVFHSTLGLSEERMMMIDGYRDNDKLKINTAEAERTNRVVERMKKEDMRGWRVLSHYHFKSKSTKRDRAKAAGVHHREIEAILRRAHENLYLWRREDAHRQNIVNPAPVLA